MWGVWKNLPLRNSKFPLVWWPTQREILQLLTLRNTVQNAGFLKKKKTAVTPHCIHVFHKSWNILPYHQHKATNPQLFQLSFVLLMWTYRLRIAYGGSLWPVKAQRKNQNVPGLHPAGESFPVSKKILIKKELLYVKLCFLQNSKPFHPRANNIQWNVKSWTLNTVDQQLIQGEKSAPFDFEIDSGC